MKVYIAGKISGDPDYLEKFYTVDEALREAGHIVLDPATVPAGLEQADYMRICFAMMESVDAVVLLPGWEDSKGANLEYAWCKYTGKLAMELEDFKAWLRTKGAAQ